MDPRVSRLSAVLMAVLAATVCAAQGSTTSQDQGGSKAGAAREGQATASAAQMMKSARSIASRGDADEALALLRTLRGMYPASSEAADALALSVEITLSQGDIFRARYLFSTLASAYGKSAAIGKTAFAIAEYCYAQNLPAALDYYRVAVEHEDRSSVGPQTQRARLRTAELSLYQAGDPDAARRSLSRVAPARLSPDDLPAYRALSIRLRWEAVPLSVLGLSDSNVSFLLADGGDVWVGTWNGGVARYSVASGSGTAFTQAAVTSRSAQEADKRIWVGTSEGLAWFSKASGRWGMAEELSTPSAMNVKALRAAGGALYAGTLGDGLFRMRGSTWERIDAVPSAFITCLFADERGSRLYIGTMDGGPFVLDMTTDRVSPVASADLSGKNVTTILRDEYGVLWIGTYGDGLYALRPGAAGLQRFSRESGEVADDWILTAHETPKAVYFGTFGGGVSVRSKEDDSWSHLGIADGLPSLDVTSIASVGSYVFFGTLGGGVVRFLEGESIAP